MRQGFVLFVVLMAFALVVSGCGRSTTDEVTYQTPDGEATVTSETTDDGETQTVTVQTDQGTETVTIKTGATITEKELGVPVYPKATVQETSTMEGENIGGATGKIIQVNMVTSDDYSKVKAFYDDKLKDVRHKFDTDQEGQKMTMYMLGDDENQIMVNVVQEKDQKETVIGVARSVKGE